MIFLLNITQAVPAEYFKNFLFMAVAVIIGLNYGVTFWKNIKGAPAGTYVTREEFSTEIEKLEDRLAEWSTDQYRGRQALHKKVNDQGERLARMEGVIATIATDTKSLINQSNQPKESDAK